MIKMDNTSTVVVVTAIVLLLGVVVPAILFFVVGAIRDKLRESKELRKDEIAVSQAQIRATEGMIRSSDALAKALSEFNQHISGVGELLGTQPKLLEGLIAVSQAQVKQLEEVSSVVGQFHRSVFAKDSEGYTEYSEAETSREYEIQQRMEKDGIDREQATRIAKEVDLYSQMRMTR